MKSIKNIWNVNVGVCSKYDLERFCSEMSSGRFFFCRSQVTVRSQVNRPFPSSPGPLLQNEGRYSAFDMEIIFHSHEKKKTHFHKQGCALSLILKVRVLLELGSGLLESWGSSL